MLLIATVVAQEWRTLVDYFAVVGIACLLFNLISMGLGYAAPRALRLPRRQALAIAMEIGITTARWRSSSRSACCRTPRCRFRPRYTAC